MLLTSRPGCTTSWTPCSAAATTPAHPATPTLCRVAVTTPQSPACWDDLPRLPYTRAVVDEALRLYPPAWVITRQALRDDDLAGLAVPAGTLVVISPWLAHRRPDVWPDPLRFDPTRFLDGPGGTGRRAALPRGEYLPFGVGPRLCIGREMALVEAVVVLAELLRGHRVTPVAPDAGVGDVRAPGATAGGVRAGGARSRLWSPCGPEAAFRWCSSPGSAVVRRREGSA